MENFGDYVRQLRKDKDWTLTKLAAMLEMDSANLSKIETGKRNFDEKKLPEFCKIFQLNLSRLSGILFLKARLSKLLDLIKPHCIHSQGFRSDLLVSLFFTNLTFI